MSQGQPAHGPTATFLHPPVGAADPLAGSAAAELSRRVERLSAFAHTVAHELRGPLRSVDGHVAILLHDEAPRLSDEGVQALGKVRRTLAHMADLVESLLDFSQGAHESVRTSEVDLTAMARAVAAEALPVGRDPRTVSVHVQDGLVCVADPRLLRRVLVNLLENALKFSRIRPQVVVEMGTRPSPDGVRTFYVRDNGIGFPHGQAPQAFQPFTRFHAAEGYEGSGIGLATAHTILLRHGGAMWVEEGPGPGATVCFSLPDA